jgi:hypothetical protein
MPGLPIALAWGPATGFKDLLKYGLRHRFWRELAGFDAGANAFKDAHHFPYPPEPLER